MRFPFWDTEHDDPLFNVHFDVIEGYLPFLIGLTNLCGMKANLNLHVKWLGVRVHDDYVKLLLTSNDGHIFLPFRAELKRDDKIPGQGYRQALYYCPDIRTDTDDLDNDSDTRETYHPSERHEYADSDNGGSIADAYAE